MIYFKRQYSLNDSNCPQMAMPTNTLGRYLRFQWHTQQVTTMTSYIFFPTREEILKRGVLDKVLALPICTALLDLQKALGISKSEKRRWGNPYQKTEVSPAVVKHTYILGISKPATWFFLILCSYVISAFLSKEQLPLRWKLKDEHLHSCP